MLVSLIHCGVVAGDCYNAKLDVVIILDTSGSVDAENFALSIDFIGNILRPLPINPDNVRVALVGYSTEAQVVSYLNDNMRKDEKIRAVSRYEHTEGSTYTNLALQIVHQEVLTTEYGDRPDVPDFIILITDGQSRNQSLTKQEATLLHRRPNIKIATVGIGTSIDEEELASIATERYFVLQVDSFNRLGNIIPGLTSVACSGCDWGKLDLVVIQDTSKSVGEENVPKCIRFIEDLLKPLPIDPDHVRVALVRYSYEAEVVSYLNDKMSKEDKIKAVSRYEYTGGATFTDLALQTTANDVLTAEAGDRPDVPDLILLLTDGRTTTPAFTMREAKRLKLRNNLKMWTLGVGSNFDPRELKMMATSRNCTVTMDSFSQLTDVIRNLTDVSCSDPLGTVRTNTGNYDVPKSRTSQYTDYSARPIVRTREPTTSTKSGQPLQFYQQTTTRRNQPQRSIRPATNARSRAETTRPVKYAPQPEDLFLTSENPISHSNNRPLERNTKTAPTRLQTDQPPRLSKSTDHRNSPSFSPSTVVSSRNRPPPIRSTTESNRNDQSTVSSTTCEKQNTVRSLACQMDKLRKQMSTLHNQMDRLINQMDKVQNQMNSIENDIINVHNQTELC
ncbi:hypothetical protein Btru_043800 [Bulinus truncatus]|nr:hypothetical protein Btru_043800 [Bulinus truncatus]